MTDRQIRKIMSDLPVYCSRSSQCWTLAPKQRQGGAADQLTLRVILSNRSDSNYKNFSRVDSDEAEESEYFLPFGPQRKMAFDCLSAFASSITSPRACFVFALLIGHEVVTDLVGSR